MGDKRIDDPEKLMRLLFFMVVGGIVLYSLAGFIVTY